MGAQGGPDSGYILPVSGMLVTQIASSMTLVAVPVLATEIARDTQMDPSIVGVYTSLIFAAAALSSSASGALIARLGPIRTNQFALCVCALSLLFALGETAFFIGLSAILVGTGYGPNTPSGSQVLARVTPPRRRALVFSVKQSGASAGAMIAGALLPWLATSFDWRIALLVATGIVLLAGAVISPLRPAFDDVARSGKRVQAPSPREAIATVLSAPELRLLVLGGFTLMMLHVCLQTFTVVYLVEHVGLEITVAGGLFALLSGASAGSRIALGWTADRLGRARGLLVGLALLGVGSVWLMASLTPSWSYVLIALVCFISGIGGAAWYGVYLAEIARRAPPSSAGLATGGTLTILFSSIVIGPLLFSALVAGLDSYPAGFVFLGLMGLFSAVCFSRLPP